jgi:diphosphomevalonate decarboxylase
MNAISKRAGVRVRALANLALVKYFGKRDLSMNLPAAGSLSLTLEPLATTTHVTFDSGLEEDEVKLAGKTAPDQFASRITGFLDIVRQMAGTDERALIVTENTFPTAAGLASSASGFAAMALATTRALGIEMDEQGLSALARRGSGSAARSVPGGVVVWNRGSQPDGSDSFAHSIMRPDEWNLGVVVGVTDSTPKDMGSTQAMELTRTTSPYYEKWIDSVNRDLPEAINAVKNRDLTVLGEVTERSALQMHAAALAATPGILYWKGATVEAIHLARLLRKSGLEVYFTCDAGPQPKLLCDNKDVEGVVKALNELPGITQIIRCKLGSGAKVISQ